MGAKAASGQKTLKSAFMRWTAEHHTFNNVVCTPADMATFGGGLLEYIQTNKDEETGEEINTIPSLKFFTPGVPKPGKFLACICVNLHMCNCFCDNRRQAEANYTRSKVSKCVVYA